MRWNVRMILSETCKPSTNSFSHLSIHSAIGYRLCVYANGVCSWMRGNTYNFHWLFADGQTTWKAFCIAMVIRCQHLTLSLWQMFQSVAVSPAALHSKWLHWHLLKHWLTQRSRKRVLGKENRSSASSSSSSLQHLARLKRAKLQFCWPKMDANSFRLCLNFTKCLCLICVLLPSLSLSLFLPCSNGAAVTRRKRSCVKEPNMNLLVCLVALWIN